MATFGGPALAADSTAEFFGQHQMVSGSLSWFEVRIDEDVPVERPALNQPLERQEFAHGTYWTDTIELPGPASSRNLISGFRYEIIKVGDATKTNWQTPIGTNNPDGMSAGSNYESKSGTSSFSAVEAGDIFTVARGNPGQRVPWTAAQVGRHTVVRSLQYDPETFARIIKALEAVARPAHIGTLTVDDAYTDLNTLLAVPMQGRVNVLFENRDRISAARIKGALIDAGFRTQLAAGDALETIHVTEKTF